MSLILKQNFCLRFSSSDKISHLTEHRFPDEASDVALLVTAGARDRLEVDDRTGEPRPDQPVLLRLDHHHLTLQGE